eukprot:jgi/Chrzof1/14751/Cz09g14170.t1
MTTSVAQLKRLVDGLGTAKDTVDYRHRMSEQQSKIQETAKRIKDQITALNTDKAELPEVQKTTAAKLLQDFATILQDYKATQKVAAEKEASSLPRAPPPIKRPATTAAVLENTGVDADIENQALLQQQQQQDARLMDNAISYNEALIEERDQGISEIQRQIGEVNEMFQDLAVLINDQGQQLQTLDSHIANTAERTREGQQELVKAERSQRSARNKCLMLWVVAAVVLSIILVMLFA